MKSLLLLSWLLFSGAALAVVEGHKYPFDNQHDTERFNQLAEDLRCPKCQNQNLADSNAPVARDMRDKVYELMQQGKSDDEVVGYMVDRYGDFVRYKPPMRLETFLLWFGPLILFALGLVLLVAVRPKGTQRQAATGSEPLTADEQAKLERLKAAAKPSSEESQKS